jgi:phosphoenolpyruvate-protein kinase (PTS system EI component)
VAAAMLEPGQSQPERNPAMGRRGVRGLLANQDVLRLQLRAILRAAATAKEVAVLVPFVTTVTELQRVQAALLEERVALKKRRVPCAADVQLAPIVELPAAALSVGALLNEADFAVIALDDLQAHLLGADRDNASVRSYHELVHPALFEILHRMCKDAERREKPLVLFGESAADPVRLPFYLGVGYRSFSIAPVRLRAVLKVLERYTVEECRRIAARVLEAPASTCRRCWSIWRRSRRRGGGPDPLVPHPSSRSRNRATTSMASWSTARMSNGARSATSANT